jgi:hypothetical protein
MKYMLQDSSLANCDTLFLLFKIINVPRNCVAALVVPDIWNTAVPTILQNNGNPYTSDAVSHPTRLESS